MSSNAKVRRHEKRNENRTGKEKPTRGGTEGMPMLTPAHIGKERYARTRVPGTPQGHHRHGRATWYEGTNKGEQINHRGEAQHTEKKKINIHT